MHADRRPGPERPVAPSRRRLLAAAALTPVLAGTSAGTGVGTSAAHAEPAVGSGGRGGRGGGERLTPVPTTPAEWSGVAKALGRPGNMMRESTGYHTAFPRHDLRVVSYGVRVTHGLALGSHVAFVRYTDGGTLLMGDLVVTEDELQRVSDALHAHGIAQTAIHKHLLAHTPDVWWTHVHAHGHDPVALARGLRAALDRTATPPTPPPAATGPVDLDTAGIDAALDVPGTAIDGIYKSLFIRRETVTDGDLVLPPGLGATTAFNFQPLGGGRAALSGDFAMVADEVQDVLGALRHGGIDLVELHHHGLRDEPRLFFTHIWAVDDAVALARTLRRAVAATHVVAAGLSVDTDSAARPSARKHPAGREHQDAGTRTG